MRLGLINTIATLLYEIVIQCDDFVVVDMCRCVFVFVCRLKMPIESFALKNHNNQTAAFIRIVSWYFFTLLSFLSLLCVAVP